ncbi:MAG: biotin/lipoyl-binding protein, partial [Chloroflexi bacterium]|nr:biotin/lipoyl-binding protein [Chloroflexota bacterium]
MKRWLFIAAIIAAITLVGGLSYFTSQTPSVQANTPAPSTVAVTRGDVQQLATASGKVVNTRKVTLSMGAGGSLSHVDVRPGDIVQAGDVLAALDTADLEQQVAEAGQAYL